MGVVGVKYSSSDDYADCYACVLTATQRLLHDCYTTAVAATMCQVRMAQGSIKLDDPSAVQSLGDAMGLGVGRAAFFNPGKSALQYSNHTVQQPYSTAIIQYSYRS